MMNFSLPKAQLGAFSTLAGLDTKAKSRLLQILESEPLSIKLDEPASKFAEETRLKKNMAEGIFWMLHHMYAARVENGVSAQDFAEGVCGATEVGRLALTDASLAEMRE